MTELPDVLDVSFWLTRYKNPDFLFVAAAGNDGWNNTPNSVASPSVNKNGISVGASQNASPHLKSHHLGPDYLADFSSRGPTRDGRRKPDIAAPGVRILSAKADPSATGECETTGTVFKTGTSMAAPVVAGAAALVRQYFMTGRHVNGKQNSQAAITPRSSLLKAVLLNSGQALVAVQNGKNGQITRQTDLYDIHQGFGRVDLSKTLPLHGENSLSGIFVNGKTIQNGKEDTYRVQIQNADQCGPLSVTLVWTDPAAAPSCNECVLNDLDLSVTLDGTGGRFYPNGLNLPDTQNNAERVQIQAVQDGQIYTIHIKGSNLISNQEYSVAVTGCFTESIDEGATNPDDEEPTIPDEANCSDGIGTFNIGTGAFRTCLWLESNLADYEYLCRFRDVALECRSTCRTCLLRQGDRKESMAPFDGKNRWFGNHFDLKAKNDITIRSYGIHLNNVGNYQIKVFSRSGQLGTASTGIWTSVCSGSVESRGYGATTAIPEKFCSPLEVKSGQWITLYVTTVEKNDLVMTRGVEHGTSLINNADILVRSGTAITFNNQGTYKRYAFNGAIHYTVDPECLDATGLVLVDDIVGERTCSWLASNRARFGFACNFLASVHCPVACDVCSDM